MIIRKLRIEQGFSQEQLAFMAGISVRTLQRIERGAKASPETLKCLAAALNTEFVELRKKQEMSAEATEAGTILSQDEQEAMEYVRDIRGFYAHAVQYVVIIAALLVINLVTNPSYLWFLWAAFGWGIGLMVHGLTVFEIINLFGDNWEKRQVSKRLAKIRSYRKDNN
ncbi:MAG: 2TM domain-containing protein [Aestuariivita sp.]|nr:2TM domain-containing protein [Aestuariivita sp.]MCY4203341.1 2TM domain-containing protein [Aestuariivita sp.]